MSYKDPDYMVKYRQRNKRTIDGWITKVYGRMRHSSIEKEMPVPIFTKEELKEWAVEKGLKQMMTRWIEGGCTKSLTPSVNRLDDYKPYEFHNMELVTWAENNSKGSKSKKVKELVHKRLGPIAKKMFSRPVMQLDLDNNILAIYPSVREAGRVTGAEHGTIAKVCRGELKTHHSYKWTYEISREN